MGTEALYQGVKHPGREADLSTIKKAWINIHSLISLHGVLLISLLKRRDTFTSAVYVLFVDFLVLLIILSHVIPLSIY
jgi:hypothetical protein